MKYRLGRNYDISLNYGIEEEYLHGESSTIGTIRGAIKNYDEDEIPPYFTDEEDKDY